MQVLTVNQVMEIILKFLETKDWKHSFFQVIPLRKRGEAGSEDTTGDVEEKGIYDDDDLKIPGEDNKGDEDDQRTVGLEAEDSAGTDDQKAKRPCIDTEI